MVQSGVPEEHHSSLMGVAMQMLAFQDAPLPTHIQGI
jgi:hypothetical protein